MAILQAKCGGAVHVRGGVGTHFWPFFPKQFRLACPRYVKGNSDETKNREYFWKREKRDEKQKIGLSEAWNGGGGGLPFSCDRKGEKNQFKCLFTTKKNLANHQVVLAHRKKNHVSQCNLSPFLAKLSTYWGSFRLLAIGNTTKGVDKFKCLPPPSLRIPRKPHKKRKKANCFN